ncbi:fungal cellulose binding domain containing protein [Apiospora marii]|uniref:Fungal cellulose binding domain containing protein n=1 Tax=Apiospora marii TaxID=335849 RepID=A0ABR1RM41_9PEZI
MLIPAVLPHYTSLALMANGRNTNAWEYLRKTTKFQSNGPVENLKWDAMLVILVEDLGTNEEVLLSQ